MHLIDCDLKNNLKNHSYPIAMKQVISKALNHVGIFFQ